MLDTFPVLVPALDQRFLGVLRPVDRARGGVLLLNGTGSGAALVPRIFAEIELYFQAAEFVVVRLDVPVHTELSRRVSSILGGVSLLRSMGADRVVVITSAPGPLASWEEARAGTLAEFMELADHGQTLPDIIQIVRNLMFTIRDVADSAVGIATLLAPAPSADAHVVLEAVKKQAAPRTSGTFGTSEGAPSSPQALVLPLPDERDGQPRAIASLISRLYSWSLALTPLRAMPTTTARRAIHTAQEAELATTEEPGAALPAVRRPVDDAGILSGARAASLDLLSWADEQWADVLQRFAQRAPEPAAHVSTITSALRDVKPGTSMRASRAAWTLLDVEARRAWLQVCSALFA